MIYRTVIRIRPMKITLPEVVSGECDDVFLHTRRRSLLSASCKSVALCERGFMRAGKDPRDAPSTHLIGFSDDVLFFFSLSRCTTTLSLSSYITFSFTPVLHYASLQRRRTIENNARIFFIRLIALTCRSCNAIPCKL